MADWRGVQEGLVSGYAVGRSTGGKKAGLGSVIAKVADRLRSQREAGEEQGRKINLLGVEGLMTGKIAPAGAEETGTTFDLPMGKFKSVTSQPEMWDIQKEARTTVNAMINQNPELQSQVFENPKLITDLIDQEADRLSQKYRGGGQVSTFTPPKITTPTEERITVISSTGQKGTIPKSQLQEALKSGYKRTLK